MCNPDDVEAKMKYIADVCSLCFEGHPFTILVTGFKMDDLDTIARVSNISDEEVLSILSAAKESVEDDLKNQGKPN